jgi:GTPase
VSSIPPTTGIDELVAAIDDHRAQLDVREARIRARRLSALREFVAERGEGALRALGGRREAERVLAEQDPAADVASLTEALERR